MLKRLYIHNFKCLQNFELEFNDLHSVLLLGKNGTGKTTIFEVIEIFQKIGQGITPIRELIHESSFNFNNMKIPIHLELDIIINEERYNYKLLIEFPENFVSPKVKSEILLVNNKPLFSRDGEDTVLRESSHFSLDWHHIGLPLISVHASDDPLAIFRDWLQNIIILSPFPRHFHEVSKKESSTIMREGENIIDWVRWLLASNPSLYPVIYDFLKIRMPDLELFRFENLGSNDRRLLFAFRGGGESKILDLAQLSDGEKIFFLAATIIAGQKNNPTILCLWDEPDNFISLVEVNHFIMELRKVFENSPHQPQLIITSHNERIVNNFSNHNIFLLSRASHLLPTRVKPLEQINYESLTVVDAYDNGELDS